MSRPVRFMCILVFLWSPLTGHAEFKYSTGEGFTNTLAGRILHAARSYLNVPYRYGGTNRSGIDCSALVQNAFAAIGIPVPRTAWLQFKSARKLKKHALRPGDLVFFRIRRNRPVSHVGIYLGSNRMLHASQSSNKVRVSDLNKPYWQQRFVSGGRLVAQG